MRYNKFGNTGFEISALGFGCMRFPVVMTHDGREVIDEDRTVEMIRKAYELGVNYFDTAYFYCGNESETVLGKALKGFRGKVKVSTKSPGYQVQKPGDYRRILEEQLKKLDTGHIDFYHFHGIGYDNFFEIDKNSGWIDDAQKAKAEGLIRHISFSFHDAPSNMNRLVDLGLFETVLCQYNVIDRSNEQALSYAKSKGLGTVVMGPLGGGRVSGLPAEIAGKLGIKAKSSAEIGLRFVFSNPDIDCAISGMNTVEMVVENAAAASMDAKLSESEIEAVKAMMLENEKLSQLYCTGCRYCMPCPQGVVIPHIFQMMNYYRIYGIKDYAAGGYAEIGTNPWTPGKKADACVECGACEEKCPQKLHIIDQLKECHSVLSGK